MNLYCSVLADNTVVLKSVVHLMKGSRANETQLPLVEKNLSFVSSEEKHKHVFGTTFRELKNIQISRRDRDCRYFFHIFCCIDLVNCKSTLLLRQ